MVIRIFSIFHSPVLGSPFRERHSWVRSLLQLPNHQVLDWKRILQLSQLVRWDGLVSLGKNHWRHNLPGLDGDLGHSLSCSLAVEHYNWHSKCLRVPGATVFILHNHRDLSPHIRNSHNGRWLGCCCNDLNRSRVHFKICRRFIWQRGYRYICHALDLLHVGQVGQDRDDLLVNPHQLGLLLYGVKLGRLRFPHQLDTSSCASIDGDGTILTSTLCRLQHRLLHWNNFVDANFVRWIPTGSIIWTHVGIWCLWIVSVARTRRLCSIEVVQGAIWSSLQVTRGCNFINCRWIRCHSHVVRQGFTMDRTILLAFGSFVCQKSHSNHRIRFWTSTDKLEFFLLRPSNSGLPLPSRTLFLLR